MHLRTVIRATVVNAKHRWDGATNPVQLVIVTRERESKDLDGTIVPVDFPEEFMKGFDYSNIWGFSSTALAPLMWLLARMCSDKLEGKKLVTKKKKKSLFTDRILISFFSVFLRRREPRPPSPPSEICFDASHENGRCVMGLAVCAQHK